MNTYHVFYKGQSRELEALTSYRAQQEAAQLFNARVRSDIVVFLVAKDGVQVDHSTCGI